MNNIPNCDLAPAMISEATEKPTIGSIQRGINAEGYLKELCEYYPTDRIAPGLQSAWLPDKELYYVSIHRFPLGTVASRTVVAKATSNTLEDAESQCMEICRKIAKQVEEARKNAQATPD